jgi:DNA replication protein DnaC
LNAYDPYDDEAHRAEARQLALRERTEHRLRLLLDRRPPVFAASGGLRPEIQQWIRRYLDDDAPGSLILIGEVGTGKSWTLWKTAETLVRAGWAGRFELAAAYEVKAATDWPVDTAQVRKWGSADLFAIDDLGAHRVNDWDADALSALIDTRWQRQRPTLIASNETSLKDIVGARAASRLAGGATIVRFKGADRRRNP